MPDRQVAELQDATTACRPRSGSRSSGAELGCWLSKAYLSLVRRLAHLLKKHSVGNDLPLKKVDWYAPK